MSTPAGAGDPMGFVAMRARQERAEKVYAALVKTKRTADHRVITYRCAQRRCLLVDVLQIPDEVIVYFPRYRRSPQKNPDSSSASARAQKTLDGDRRWIGHVAVLRHTINLTMNCDHVLGKVIDLSSVQADVDAGHAEVLIDAEGKRSTA